ncbi:MAG: hypothetical protein ACTSVB_08790 [Candidatus Heimdallarchaeaceae archaeon]
METLLKESNINPSNLQRVVLKMASNDVNNLSQPCYIPGHKKEYHTLLNATGLTDKNIKDFAKRTYKGTIAQAFNIANEPGTNLLLFIMWYALRKRNKTLYHGTLLYHMIRQYGHVMMRHFKKFCSEEVFSYALETLTKTHLFSREKTIANSLFHLTRELQKKYTRDIQTFNVDGIIQFISGSRHRISQSVKSFAEHYYRAYKAGDALKTQTDETDPETNAYQAQSQERGKKIIDATVRKLTVYKTIDDRAMREAKQITKIKTVIADLITRQLKDIKYADEIRLILQMFVKDTTDASMFCGKNYYAYVRKLMAVKRTRARIYFKQQINILLMKVLKDIGYTKTFNSYTTQTQFIIHSYLAYYLTLCMRNIIC